MNISGILGKNVELVVFQIFLAGAFGIQKEVTFNLAKQRNLCGFTAAGASGGAHHVAGTLNQQGLTRIGDLNVPGQSLFKGIQIWTELHNGKIYLSLIMSSLGRIQQLYGNVNDCVFH